MKSRNSAFTLIELLTVIAIIGILAAIIIPVTSKVRASARKTQCLSNMRQIGVGLTLFANDNKRYFPTATSPTWYWQVAPYAGVPEGMLGSAPLPKIAGIFVCPSYDYVSSPRQSEICYGYNAFITPNYGATHWNYRADIPDSSRTFLVVEMNANSQIFSPVSGAGTFDPRHGEDTANYLFVDGHVESIAGGPIAANDPRWYRTP